MKKKILIINRGEIALRILRASKELGYRAVIAYSEADKTSLPVRLADEALCIGPASSAKSYLNTQNIIAAAEIADAHLIHPGYGFLSENTSFARQVEEHGFTLIGPSSEHIRLMGDKVQARAFMNSHGIPTVPGSEGKIEGDIASIQALAESIGYPVLLKASGGGGGRGMRLVHHPQRLAQALEETKQEAKVAFGNDDVYMEKFLSTPRHIEIQVLSDGIQAIALGARDCSMQRRYQKVIEESMPVDISREQIEQIGDLCADVCRKINYKGAGTFEFLYEKGQFYFIEMNTRIQVEHPVTEMITGIDLLKEQILIADGVGLRYTQEDITYFGHSIECRINAEDSESFSPDPGLCEFYHPPGGFGVRMDTHLYTGYKIPPFYDSLIGKLIVHGTTRQEALEKMSHALEELVIEGLRTNINFHKKLIAYMKQHPCPYSINTVEQLLNKVPASHDE